MNVNLFGKICLSASVALLAAGVAYAIKAQDEINKELADGYKRIADAQAESDNFMKNLANAQFNKK